MLLVSFLRKYLLTQSQKLLFSLMSFRLLVLMLRTVIRLCFIFMDGVTAGPSSSDAHVFWYYLLRRPVVMVRVTGQFDYSSRCSGIWLDIILGVSVRLFLDETTFVSINWVKQTALPTWANFIPCVEDLVEKKGRVRGNLLSLPDSARTPISPALRLGIRLELTPLAVLVFGRSDPTWNYTPAPQGLQLANCTLWNFSASIIVGFHTYPYCWSCWFCSSEEPWLTHQDCLSPGFIHRQIPMSQLDFLESCWVFEHVGEGVWGVLTAAVPKETRKREKGDRRESRSEDGPSEQPQIPTPSASWRRRASVRQLSRRASAELASANTPGSQEQRCRPQIGTWAPCCSIHYTSSVYPNQREIGGIFS